MISLRSGLGYQIEILLFNDLIKLSSSLFFLTSKRQKGYLDRKRGTIYLCCQTIKMTALYIQVKISSGSISAIRQRNSMNYRPY